MRLSLCMIVRDNQDIIAECLTSIRPWVDEMNVVDTGSTDGTPRIAASLGARVSSFPWIDDFSAARNASLDMSRGEWNFWMDSDDVIDAENGQKLKALAAENHDSSQLGFVMQVHCPGLAGERGGDVTVVDHVKMFRNRPDLQFEGRIHEQVLPAVRRAGGEVGWTDIFVTHRHGAVTPEAKAGKHTRDLHILKQELAERGDHPFVLFNLGMTYADMEQPRKAAEFLQRSIEVAGPSESHLPKAFALLVACYVNAAEHDRAAKACQEARQRFPHDTEILFRSAIVAHQQQRHDEAIRMYQELLDRPTNSRSASERQFSSCDIGIAGHKARHNLAIILSEQNRWAEAELQWRLALAEAPYFQPALTALGEALIRQEKFATARQLSRQWLNDAETHCAALLIDARVAEALRQLEQAIQILQEATQAHPERIEPLEDLGRLLFAAGRMAEAEPVLARLAELRPDDGAVAHNLGGVYLALGRKPEAATILRKSLDLRPDATATRQLLDLACSDDAAK